jgi:opacity protein-like surface antigen
MKLRGFVITAVVVGLSGPAFAQTGSGQQTAANPPASQAVAVLTPADDNPRGWMASGFIGTNFGGSRKSNVDLALIEDLDTNTSTSVNFGGQVGYLARGVIGGEFLADFSPGLGGFDNLLFKNPPNLNSYMFNLIAVAPFGHAQSYDPYISGGIGAVTISSDIFTVDPTRATNLNALATDTINGTRFGWNIGGGVMAWSEKNWGFRGDVRYYATNSHNTDVLLDLNNIDEVEFTRLELSGIRFWKANAGVAFRW